MKFNPSQPNPFKQKVFTGKPDEVCDGEHADKFLFGRIPKRASSNSRVHHCKKCLKYILSGVDDDDNLVVPVSTRAKNACNLVVLGPKLACDYLRRKKNSNTTLCRSKSLITKA